MYKNVSEAAAEGLEICICHLGLLFLFIEPMKFYDPQNECKFLTE
jgi:hypothetical protein